MINTFTENPETILGLSMINFTVGDLLELVKDCNDDAVFYNSCMNSPYTLEHINDDTNNIFEPILAFQNEDTHLIAEYNFTMKDKCVTLGEFKKFVTDLNINLNISIERDLDDGYVFENYGGILATKDRIILLRD